MSSPDDLLDREFWTGLLDDVRGAADDWIEKHRDDLVEIGKEEAKLVFEALSSGDSLAAKRVLARKMDAEQWAAYRNGTTAALGGVANRRARLYKAFGELGVRAAKTVSRAVLSALGV